jgi:hypothetical protein
LSVSLVPNAWRAIAKLGGLPLWEFQKEGNKFLDVLRMSKALQTDVRQWACENGFASEQEGWVTVMHDEEGGIRSVMSATREQAVADWGEGEDDNIARRFATPMLFPTEKLEEYARQRIELSLVTDMATIAYADQVLGLDGLYWNETLDVAALSAPRGGIIQSRLHGWKLTHLKSDMNPKEEQY